MSAWLGGSGPSRSGDVVQPEQVAEDGGTEPANPLAALYHPAYTRPEKGNHDGPPKCAAPQSGQGEYQIGPHAYHHGPPPYHCVPPTVGKGIHAGHNGLPIFRQPEPPLQGHPHLNIRLPLHLIETLLHWGRSSFLRDGVGLPRTWQSRPPRPGPQGSPPAQEFSVPLPMQMRPWFKPNHNGPVPDTPASEQKGRPPALPRPGTLP